MKRVLFVILVLALLLDCCVLASGLPSRPGNHVHHWVAMDTIMPTCTESGMVYEQCSECGEGRQRRLAPLGHLYSNPWTTIQEPTCEEPGKEHNTCSRCGYEWYRDIPALGHDLGEWYVVKEAANGVNGVKEQKCNRCGQVYAQTIYFEDDPDTYGMSLSVEIDDPREFYYAGDAVHFTCTLTNISDVEVDTYYARFLWYSNQEFVWMEPDDGIHAHLKPGDSITYSHSCTLTASEIHGSDLYDDVSGVRAQFYAMVKCDEGIMTSNTVEFVLPTPMLSLYAWSTEWDEESVVINCELTNNSSYYVVLNGHSYIGTDGKAGYITDFAELELAPDETVEYTVTIPVKWAEDSYDPEGEIISLQADGVTLYTKRPVLSAAVPVHVGYEIGDMELIIDQTETSAPANGVYYTEGETINYEITLSNSQYYRLYQVAAVVIPYEYNAYTVGEAEVMPGSGVLKFSAYHTVNADDCERGYYENNVYATWYSGKDELDEEPNEMDGPGVVSLCGTGEIPVLSKREISTPPNGEYYLPGDTVVYELIFVNGPEQLSGMALYDSMFVGSDSHMVAALPELAPGETYTATFGYTVDYKDAAEGEIVNMATAHAAGEGLDELPYVNSNLVTVFTGEEEAEPSGAPAAYPDGLTLYKYEISVPANAMFYTAGETVYYNIAVINDGLYALSDISVFDQLSGLEPIRKIGTLKPGETVTVDYNYTVTAMDVNKGYIANVAFAQIGAGSDQFEYSNEVIVPTGYMPVPDYSQSVQFDIELQVVNTPANGLYYERGEVIQYEATVINRSAWLCMAEVSAATLNDSSSVIDLGSYTMHAYESITVPIQHMVSDADALSGSVTMTVTANALFDLPEGTDQRTAYDDETVSCKSGGIKPVRPGDLKPPVQGDEDAQEKQLVLIQTLTNLPVNGKSYMPGETVEIDLTLINYTDYRMNSVKFYDVLCDAPGHLVGSVDKLVKGTTTVHFSYTVTEDDLKLGKVYSDAWATLGLRVNNRKLITLNAETLEIPVGKEIKDGIEAVRPGRRPIPGRLGSRRMLVVYTEGLLSVERASKLALAAARDDVTAFEALKQVQQMWETAFETECDRLKKELGSDEAVQQALENDRTLYSAYLDAYEARLTASGADDAAVCAALTDTLRDQASEIGYILDTKGGAREDLGGAVSEAAASFEDDETAYSIETVNEFSYIKTVKAGKALRPYVLLAQRILEDETLSDAERWENVAAVWRSVLDIRYAELTDASEGSLASLLAAERAAFLIYADARGALYRLVYSDEAVAAELVARLIEEKTVQMSK